MHKKKTAIFNKFIIWNPTIPCVVSVQCTFVNTFWVWIFYFCSLTASFLCTFKMQSFAWLIKLTVTKLKTQNILVAFILDSLLSIQLSLCCHFIVLLNYDFSLLSCIIFAWGQKGRKKLQGSTIRRRHLKKNTADVTREIFVHIFGFIYWISECFTGKKRIH